MRGPILFVVAFVVATVMGALLARPAPGEAAASEDAPFAFFAGPRMEDERRVVALSGAGEVPGGSRVCRAEGQCMLAGPSLAVLPLVETDGLDLVEVVVEWRPSSASTQRLGGSLRACTEDECGDALARATSGSPLRLSLSGEDLEEGLLMLFLEPEDLAPAAPVVSVTTTDQPFSVAGEAAFR